jgi:hypothetical protein
MVNNFSNGLRLTIVAIPFLKNKDDPKYVCIETHSTNYRDFAHAKISLHIKNYRNEVINMNSVENNIYFKYNLLHDHRPHFIESNHATLANATNTSVHVQFNVLA